MNTLSLARRASLYPQGRDRGTQFNVRSARDPAPVSFLTIPGHAKEQVILNFSGGCKHLTDEVRSGMFGTVAAALTRDDGSTFAGVLMSGSTTEQKEETGSVNAMVTQIPSYIAGLEGFDVVAMGHTPRTGQMSLGTKTGRLVLDDYYSGLDHDYTAIMLEQPDVNTPGGWDFDVAQYMSWLTGLRDNAGFKIGNTIINGGDVTRREIYDGLVLSIPTIVCAKSGRESDAFVAAFEHDDWTLTAAELRAKKSDTDADAAIDDCRAKLALVDRDLVYIADFFDAASLRAGFVRYGCL